jgi:nucleoside-diphosphate-sugar epimerase
MKSCVIVHGANNFVGSKLVAALEREPWAMVRAVRAGDALALHACLPDAQAIAHCVLGTAAQIETGATALYGLLAASNAKPRVVHLSSMTIYGSAAGLIDESCAMLADLGPYSAAQLRAEQLAAEYSQAVILRSGVEYGPTCAPWSGRVAQWLRARRLGDLGENGDGVCNLVYIDDLTAVILSALRQPAIQGEIFNVAAHEKLRWNEYFTTFAVALGAVPVRRISARRLNLETRLAAPALRLAELIAAKTAFHRVRIPPAIPPSLLRLCRQEITLSVARAEQILDARWTPLQYGLRRTAEFYG